MALVNVVLSFAQTSGHHKKASSIYSTQNLETPIPRKRKVIVLARVWWRVNPQKSPWNLKIAREFFEVTKKYTKGLLEGINFNAIFLVENIFDFQNWLRPQLVLPSEFSSDVIRLKAKKWRVFCNVAPFFIFKGKMIMTKIVHNALSQTNVVWNWHLEWWMI